MRKALLVEDDELVGPAADLLQRTLAVGDGLDVPAVLAEVEGHQLDDVRVVLDHERLAHDDTRIGQNNSRLLGRPR